MKFDDSITYAKAFAIIMMVAAHAWIFEFGREWINMFHMPLFFFASGYCFKTKYLDDLRTYAKRRITNIYLPSLKYGIIFVLLHNVFFRLNIYNEDVSWNGHSQHQYSWGETAKHLIDTVIRLDTGEQLLGGYWFMNAIFFASFFSYAIIKLFKFDSIRSAAAGCLVALAMCVMLEYFDFHASIIGLQSMIMMATLFILIGFCFAKFHVRHWNIITITMSVIVVGIGVLFWHGEMIDYNMKTLLPYICTAIIGSWMMISLCKWLDNYLKGHRMGSSWIQGGLTYIGTNTFTILSLHFLTFKLVNLIIVMVYGLPIRLVASFPVLIDESRNGWCVIYIIAGISIPLLFLWLGDKVKERIGSQHKQTN